MRLHQLEVTAFGPFCDTETVDFDDLGHAGLFLLCGPTGAGKTSILDAVSFALYGEVPGDRNSAKRLRSDHAAPGAAPRVRLELSLAGRRFRVTRSPAWQRPKRRGTGTTTEHAKVSLEEHVDGEWAHLSNRLDETGQLLNELLGMTAAQFTQVAMLPQGRFQSFLRARSDERHKVLQRLFRTERFEDVEKWLVARRQSLRATNRGHQEAVASVVSRVAEAAATDLPEDWDLADLAPPAEDGRLTRWLEQLLAEVGQRHEDTRIQADAAARSSTEARERWEQARTTVELRARHREARRLADSLGQSEQEAEETRAALRLGRRAASVRPLVALREEAERRVGQTRRRLVPALSAAAGLLDPPPPDEAERTEGALPTDTLTTDALTAAEQRAREAAAVARALLPREAELARAREALTRETAAVEQLRARTTTVEQQLDLLPDRLIRLRAEVDAQAELAAELPLLEEREGALAEQLEAAHRAEDLAARLQEARARHQLSVDAAQEAREAMHEVREARINGMAAELAVALATGDSCPVCGSAEHPAPARPVEGSPTQGDEQTAREAYENADFVRQTHAEAVTTLEQGHAVAAHASAGRTVGALRSALDGVRARAEAARAARTEQDRVRALLADVEREQADLSTALAEARTEAAAAAARRDQAGGEVDRLEEEISALFAEGDVAESVTALIEQRTAAGEVFAAAREALAEHETAVAAARAAAERADDGAREHGFDDTDEAVAAVRDPEEVEAWESWLERRGLQADRAERVLHDPAVVAAVGGEEPDVAALAEELGRREEKAQQVATDLEVLQQRLARLGQLSEDLAQRLDAWAPTRRDCAVATAVSSFAEGKSGDNTLQMRLSGYVLAERLRQVVAAANERLHAMSDERYTLEHSTARGAGESRGGLSLLVRDEWTGESRDPATLSGGETFVVSLALALGLADVVTGEAGGADVDTLFIDEGFGSLDPETLDDVMDTLDQLRDGGRVVGIVSHVPEMRTRIPTQLRLLKARGGSRVQAVRESV